MKSTLPLSFAIALSIVLPAYAESVATPVLRYGFDELSGMTALDALSKGNDATFIQNATRSKDLPPTGGINHNALLLKDKSYITTPRVGFNNRSFSVAAWLKTTANNENQVILSNGDPTKAGKNLVLRLSKNGALQFSFKEDDTHTPDHVFTPGMWHHTAFTFDKSTRQRRMYVDGVLLASGTSSGVYATTGITDIGRWNVQPFGSEYWQGLMDDVTVYEGVLSEGEIAALATRSEGSSPSRRRASSQSSALSAASSRVSHLIGRIERLQLRHAIGTYIPAAASSSSSPRSSVASRPTWTPASSSSQSSKPMMSASSVAPMPQINGSAYRVTSFQLNLRVDSRATSTLIRTLKPGEELLVHAFLKNGWARVETMDGRLGYVHAGFIEPVR